MNNVKVANAHWVFDKYYKDILSDLYGQMEPKQLCVKANYDGLIESKHNWILTYL